MFLGGKGKGGGGIISDLHGRAEINVRKKKCCIKTYMTQKRNCQNNDHQNIVRQISRERLIETARIFSKWRRDRKQKVEIEIKYNLYRFWKQ